MDRWIGLDLRTLAKLNFYLFAPALLFTLTSTTTVTGPEAAAVAAFTLLHGALMFAAAWTLLLRGRLAANREILSMGAAFYNCGNFGIPVVLLAFGRPQLELLVVVILVQNLGSYLVGAWLLERHERPSPWRTTLGMLRLPMLWAVLAGGAFRLLEAEPPAAVGRSLGFLGDALVPAALLTLGVQIRRAPWPRSWSAVGALGALRLAVSPLVAVLVCAAMGIDGTMRALLVAVASFPMAVNIFIVAAQYEHDSELASQGVAWTTLASAATVSLVLWLVL